MSLCVRRGREREGEWECVVYICQPLRKLFTWFCFWFFPFCRQVLDQDNYSPIPVSTEQEYRHYTSQFPLQDPELEKVACQREVKRTLRLIFLLLHYMMQYSSPWCFINKLLCLTCWVTGVFWIKSWFSSFSFSFPSPRSFPSLSLCQKSTANSRSSSTLVWNTLKIYTSGTPTPECLLLVLTFLFKFTFSEYWNSKHSGAVVATCCHIPALQWFSAIFPFKFSSLMQTNKQTFPGWFFPVWQGAFVSLQLARTGKCNTTIRQSRPVSVPYTVEVKWPY